MIELRPLRSVHRIAAMRQPGGSLFDIQIECVYSIGVANQGPAKADVLQGTLDIMILQTLVTLGASHGYAIAARLEQVSSGRVQLNMGTLYPGLMRLEQRGFISGTWGVTDNKRRARFYAITAAGRRQLAVDKREWNRTVTTMQALLSESK
ncbi:MAG TPA: PadR family transcriptional regulator [Vicinamibacterales bacterium]|jgi:transcriptional regulator